MAIQLNSKDKRGFTSDYWKLTSYTVEIDTSKAHGLFQVFKSKADFTAGEGSGDSVTQPTGINLGSATTRSILSDLEAAAIAVDGKLSGGTIVA